MGDVVGREGKGGEGSGRGEGRGVDEEVGRCEGRGGVEGEEWGMMEDE